MRAIRSVPKLYVLFIGMSFLCVVLFFFQLYITNTVNREGVARVAELEKEATDYREQLQRIESDIARYAALERVEQRAKELGFEKRDSLEYIR